MERLLKLLIVIILITLGSVITVFADSTNKVIIDKIMKMYELERDSYDIEILSNPLKAVETEHQNITIRPLMKKEPLGLFSVIIRIYENGRIIESGQVRMRIRKFAEVLVITDKFKRHELFKADRIVTKRMDITNLREQPLVSFNETNNYQCKRNLRKGTILTRGALEPVPDIEAGRETLIVYNDGLCRITAPGIALQTGVAGDYIKVKNKATNKIIVARIVDESAVAIDP